MIEKVKIIENKNTPLSYLPDVECFGNGVEFNFKNGVNVIIGPNGCGKTTLLKLIRKYLLIDRNKQSEKFVNGLFDISLSKNNDIKDGVAVYSDYNLTTFNFSHVDELCDNGSDRCLESYDTFCSIYSSFHSSTGESVKISLNSLFSDMFIKDAKLNFPIAQLKKMSKDGNDAWKKYAEKYLEYIEKYNVPSNSKDYEITAILDEPDRNLDILNIDELYNILSYKKEHVQLIATIHNPILIYKLMKCNDVNIIELKEGYADAIKKTIEKLK